MSRARILVVDDDEPVRRGLRRILGRVGFDVIGVGTNAEAFASIANGRPDVVVSDFNRPEGTGLDFLRSLSTRRETATIPVVILSGNCNHEQELLLRRLGTRFVLHKPVGVDALVDAINQELHVPGDPIVALLNAGEETDTLDYKLTLDLESKTVRAELARDCIAMANAGGGTIVIGVEESSPGRFQLVGVSDDVASRLETSRVGNAVRRYVATSVKTSAQRVERLGMTFIVIRVAGVTDTVAMAAAGNQNADLHPGRIYMRTYDGRSAEIQDPPEVRRLIDRLVHAREDARRERGEPTSVS